MKILLLLLFILLIFIIKYLLSNITFYNKFKLCGYGAYDIICKLKLINGKHEIEKNLWLGDFRSGLDTEFLVSNNIKLVVNLSKDLDFTKLNIEKYRVPIHDNRSQESNIGMIKHFPNINTKIQTHINNNEGVLVHCRAGLQRSATVIALYLMKKHKIDFESAKSIIRSKRGIVFYPVVNFIEPIKYFEKTF